MGAGASTPSKPPSTPGGDRSLTDAQLEALMIVSTENQPKNEGTLTPWSCEALLQMVYAWGEDPEAVLRDRYASRAPQAVVSTIPFNSKLKKAFVATKMRSTAGRAATRAHTRQVFNTCSSAFIFLYDQSTLRDRTSVNPYVAHVCEPSFHLARERDRKPAQHADKLQPNTEHRIAQPKSIPSNN